jgi:uncharacterized protein (DUF427 family)
MPRAIWNGQVIAETEVFELVEGNVYFPPSSLRMEFLRPAPQTTICPWKGTAQYYDLVVQGQVNAGAAWYYATPKPDAARIKDHVAFWRGVTIER